MATEIERKYLVISDQWKQLAENSTLIRQGYLIGSKQASVRVRIEGNKSNINIKSATLGIERMEYEYPIPISDAFELLDTLCIRPQIEKTRYIVHFANHRWEVDLFHGDNQGLIVAEVELTHKDEKIELPAWVGKEVSHDIRYYNTCLVNNPYKQWNQE